MFETFKPVNQIVKQYVDYYYLDIKPDNKRHVFHCFPHFNNTISIYKSSAFVNGEIIYDQSTQGFQIFTPIRDTILKVVQNGKVHRIVIVFHPLGIQQFFRDTDFSNFIYDANLMASEEVKELFSTTKLNKLTQLLDDFFEKRFVLFENFIMEQSINCILSSEQTISIQDLANQVNVSRQHLNRLFQHNLGVSPKRFQDIVRFRKAINSKLFKQTKGSLTELAYQFNFSDQSHLIKLFQKFTKQSPKTFFNLGVVLGNEDTYWHLD